MGGQNPLERTAEAVDFPRVILIDNCNACNLRCAMCDHVNMKKYRPVQLMDIRLYQRLIDEIALENPDARVWEIFFGEPFMCFDMDRRIAYAKDQGLTDVVLNTNGTRMTPQRAAGVIKAGLDAIYVGIDAATKETYDQIRIGGDFEAVVKNTLAYRDLLAKHGRPGQQLFVQLVVSGPNRGEVDPFIAFWNRQGVQVKIRPKVSWAGLVPAQNLLPPDQVERRPCYWLMQTINICADGKVALCSVDVHGRGYSGDINRSTIKKIWHGQLKQYRRYQKEHHYDKLPVMCRDCADWQSAHAQFHYTEGLEKQTDFPYSADIRLNETHHGCT